jgi:hypothetical protein
VWAESGDKTQPKKEWLQLGWPMSSVPPSRQRFNWVLNFLMNGVRYLTRRGVPDYSDEETYSVGDCVIGPDGRTYQSLQNDNTDHTPYSSPLHWEQWGLRQSDIDLDALGVTRFLRTGAALPTKDVGPVWHEDYNDWMTWQVFNQNGANYTGYASRLVGNPLMDAQPTPRPGYIPMGVSLGRTAYAALRAWAMHVGNMVAPGVWKAGEVVMCDNADGETFTVYDLRGEFPRYWDAGRGVDSGRAFGSAQEDAIRNITGVLELVYTLDNRGGTGAFSLRASGNSPIGGTGSRYDRSIGFDASRVVPTASENLVKNTALFPSIKF